MIAYNYFISPDDQEISYRIDQYLDEVRQEVSCRTGANRPMGMVDGTNSAELTEKIVKMTEMEAVKKAKDEYVQASTEAMECDNKSFRQIINKYRKLENKEPQHIIQFFEDLEERERQLEAE